jgi:DNA-binding transcriptional LysR family regulator
VEEGAGYSFVSRLAASRSVSAGRLRIVKAPGMPVKRRFYVARLRTASPSGSARALIAMLQKNR